MEWFGYVSQNYIKEYKEENIKIYGNTLSGMDYRNNTVQYLKEKLASDITVYNRNGQVLSNADLVGTGCRVVYDGQELVALLYGDVNGDGKINSVDLLVLQRHILEIEMLTGVYLSAGNISKNGKNPSSYDSLIIQRHILEFQIIEQ